MNWNISRHAREEMTRRGISEALLMQVLNSPQQIVLAQGGRNAYQSQIDFGAGQIYLVRAIVDDRVDPAVVITVYRTSKISKYWSMP